LLADAMCTEGAPVLEHAHAVTGRLQPMARLLRLGRSARALAHSILVIHGATTLSVLFITAVCIDWFADGQLDMLQLLS